MTHQAPPSASPAGSDPGHQVARLREALRLVERIAGRAGEAAGDAGLDEAARISAGFDAALPVAQRRFEALAAEASLWTAAGVEALLAGAAEAPPRAAAARLADRLGTALGEITSILAPASR